MNAWFKYNQAFNYWITYMKKTTLKFFWPLLALMSLVACNQLATDEVIVDDSKTLAEVGEYKVTEAYLSAFLYSKGLTQPTEQQQAQALEGLVKQLSLAHQANKSGLKLTQQQAFEIKQAKQLALAQVAIEQHLIENPITDEDLKTEYKRISDELKGEEFHVRHLLYQDEAEALQVLDEIKGSGDYLTAEKAYLLVNPSTKNVGNLGWVNIMQVPEVFRKPLQTMQADDFHPQTLISQYGVHILYLDGKRPLVAPDFSEVEAGIRQTLRQRKIDRYQQLMVIKSKAKVSK